ncbi:MAG: mechanosensitive ion channel family protein [Elusimicrobia bacterium]|nr:mechanosensitive ion channel family protein [Elusimicrobiota bacterium]
MKSRSILALLLCSALVSPGAAQVRAVAPIPRAPAGIGVVPTLRGSLHSGALSLGGGVLPALPSTSELSAAPAPAPAAPLSPAEAVRAAAGALDGTRGDDAPAAAEALRAESERFWSASDAKRGVDDAVPAPAPSQGRVRARLLRGAADAAPALAAVAAAAYLPAWAEPAAPYVQASASLSVAYALTRASRWIIDALAPHFGWDRYDVIVRRFLTSAALWIVGAGVGLTQLGLSNAAWLAIGTGSTTLGVSDTTLLAIGAGSTMMALAIMPAVRDVINDIAGNIINGVHFILSRPLTVGDKATIGKNTGVVHDMTLRYLILKDEFGRSVHYTHNAIAAAAVTLYSKYEAAKELHIRPLWKPLLLSALAAAALSLLPLLPAAVKGASASWLAAGLPYLKAGAVAFLTGSLARSLQAGIERMGWTRPMTTVAKRVAALLAWIVGGSFLLTSVGVSWAMLPLLTVLLGALVTDYISTAVQCFIMLILKPFRIGDRVSIGLHEGVVIDITLQHVVLQLDDERHVRIPHSVVKDSAIATPREYGVGLK